MNMATKFLVLKEATGEPAKMLAPQTAKDRTELRPVWFPTFEAAQRCADHYNKNAWHPSMRLAVKEVAA
jgi:hypothetical protein